MAIKRDWKVCPAQGCGKRHARLLKYCTTHESNYARNGHPTERRVTRHELNPYRPVVTEMLRRHADHEAVVRALKLTSDLLYHFGADTNGATVGRLARPYLDAIIRAGGEPIACLIECAALAFYYQSKRNWPEEKIQVMAFATRFLLTVPGAQGHLKAWPRRVSAALGYRIIEQLRGFFLEMWIVHERTLAAAASDQKVLRTFSNVTV